MIFDIHLEKIDDHGEKLKRLIGTKRPFILSLVPVLLNPNHPAFGTVYPQDYHYPEEVVRMLRDLVGQNRITIGQQGFTHYCQSCWNHNASAGRERRDPWHENFCLYDKEKRVLDQRNFMLTGVQVIEESIGASPDVYCPPNHQFDRNTVQAASEIGFLYLADRDFLEMDIHQDGSLVVLPERKFGKGGEVNYIHYDQIQQHPVFWDKFYGATDVHFTQVKDRRPAFSSWLNTKVVRAHKRIRDLEKLF